MGKAGDSGEVPPGLARLPPGRHGLSRDFVQQNQRDRLAAGVIATVAANGYHDTTISRIVEAAGLSRRTFYTYFSSKEECYLATWEMIAEHLRTAAAEAAEAEEEWPPQVRARLEAVLEAFAANPDLARYILIAPTQAGNEIAARYREAMVRTLAQLTEGLPDGDDSIQRPSPATEQALIGGTVALIVREVDEGRGGKLPKLLPELTEVVLSPYLGRERAAAVAGGK